MEITQNSWLHIQNLFNNTFKNAFYYSLATVSADGTPHVAPIGSLILKDIGKGFYFEEYMSTTPKNLKENNKVCIMAVNKNKWNLLKFFVTGKFIEPAAVRLIGKVGEKREASTDEINTLLHRVKKYRFFKGHKLLWSRLRYVRDIDFDSFEPIRIGNLTKGQWDTMKKEDT